MGAGGGKLHQHEVGMADVVVGLAIEATAHSIPSSNNVTSTVYLRRLGLGRKATQVAQRTKENLFLGTCELPHALQQLELIVSGYLKQNT